MLRISRDAGTGEQDNWYLQRPEVSAPPVSEASPGGVCVRIGGTGRRDGAERGGSLLLVGKAKLDEVRSRLSTVEKSTERSVNPTVYSVEEFRSKLANGNHFLTGVLKGQNVFLLGDEDELRKVGRVRLAKAGTNQP
jgi:hypothetical protein